MRRALVVGLLMLVGCGGKTVTIHGTISSRDPSYSACLRGAGGMQVTIHDGSGTVIGTTHSGHATVVELGPPPGEDLNTCTDSAPYSLSVPKADFYQVEIGCGENGSTKLPVMSYDDLASQSFTVDMTETC